MLIKICGLKRLEDIEYANILKPDFIGFVFASSKRKIDIDLAIKLRNKLNKDIKVVGVFRNDDIELIKEVVKNNIIDLIQLHGNEDDSYILKIKEFTNLPIIKAYRDSKYSDYSLFDNDDPGKGIVFDWNSINTKKPFFLAGGININNIDAALKINPYCIDVSSGVEENGFKNFDKMKELIKKVRQELNDETIKN